MIQKFFLKEVFYLFERQSSTEQERQSFHWLVHSPDDLTGWLGQAGDTCSWASSSGAWIVLFGCSLDMTWEAQTARKGCVRPSGNSAQLPAESQWHLASHWVDSTWRATLLWYPDDCGLAVHWNSIQQRNPCLSQPIMPSKIITKFLF